jgi:hypothetical protein
MTITDNREIHLANSGVGIVNGPVNNMTITDNREIHLANSEVGIVNGPVNNNTVAETSQINQQILGWVFKRPR